ncbi:MAG: hypothetical protein JO079_10005 [Frankiaceae bacterium]|nr:hypothetical protein [Frankiaceae bacterium]MBV9369407.1 hypothetical protein [Frankiales bacterium]
MRRPIFVRTAVVTAAAALVLTGCGSGAGTTSSKDPKTAFSSGINGLNDTDVLTVTLKLDTTADKLLGFARESGDKLDPAIAKDIASGRIIFETKTTNGKKLSEIKPGQANETAARFAFEDNGTTYAELRSRDNTLYVHADVKGLLDLFQKSKMYADLQARAAQMPTFVKALVGGEWVSLNLDVLKSLANQVGGSAAASPNPAQMQKLIADLKAVIGKDVAVTRVGTDDQGDHLQLTAQSRQLITDVLQAAGGAIPAAGLALGKFDPTKTPDHSIKLDAWVKDGVLAKVSLDIAQFAKPGEAKPGDSLPVVLTFDQSGDDIAKPDKSTPVDLSQLGSLLGSLGA